MSPASRADGLVAAAELALGAGQGGDGRRPIEVTVTIVDRRYDLGCDAKPCLGVALERGGVDHAENQRAFMGR